MAKKQYFPIQSSIYPFGFLGEGFDNVIDYMLNDLVSNRHTVRDILEKKIQYPKANIYNNDESELIFDLAVPGLEKEDIEVTFHDNVLSVSYEKEEEKEKNCFLIRELKKSSFNRSWKLNETFIIDEEEEIVSELKNGLLKIVIPLKREKKKQSIKVKIL